jgi:hypothetical protein
LNPGNSKSILFLSNLEEAEFICSRVPNLEQRDVEIISLAPEADIFLEDRGHSYKSIWDYVDTADFLPMLEAARNLAESWYREIFPTLEASFEEQVLYADLEGFFLGVLMCAAAARQVLERISPRFVLTLPLIGRPKTLVPEKSFFEDVFNSVLHFVLREMGIQRKPLVGLAAYQYYYWQKSASIESLHTFLYRKKVSFLERLLQRKRDGSANGRIMLEGKNPAKKARILLFGWHWDFERQMTLEDFIERGDLPDVEFVHMYFGPRQADGIYSAPNVISIADFLDTGPGRFKSKLRVLEKKRKFKNLPESLRSTYPAIFANPWLHIQLQFHYWNRLHDILQKKRVCQAIIDKLRPDVICLSDVDTSYPRVMGLLAKKHGIRTVSFNHGAYNYIVPRAIMHADFITVWGKGTQEAVVQGGTDPSKIHIVGNQSWRDIYLDSQAIGQANTGQAALIVHTRFGSPVHRKKHQPNSPKGQQSILVITSALTLAGLQPYINLRKHREALEAIIGLGRTSSNLRIIIKSHPSSDWLHLYDWLIRRIDKNVLHITREATVQELALDADIVIVPNTISSAMFEVLPYKKPVIYVCNAVDENAKGISRSFHRAEEIGLAISDLSKLSGTVNRLLDDENFKQNVIARGQRYLDLFGSIHEDSLSRIHRLIALATTQE